MVIRRIITGVLVAGLVGLIIWVGEPYYTIAACLVAALATFEFYRLVHKDHISPLLYFGIVLSLLFIVSAHIQSILALPILLAIITVVPLTWVLFRKNKDNSFTSWAWTVAGILYIGFMLSFYVKIRAFPDGREWAYVILACTALCDAFAYAIGSTLGKHFLASSISPGKTWEGAAGGMAASILFALILGTCFQLHLQWWMLLILGAIIGLFSQIGDLAESLLKRNTGAKDAGTLLPGHGGMLDRIDSHLLIAPIAYYLILLIKELGWSI